MANVAWEGVWLRDVLADAGLTAADAQSWLRHVHFEGADGPPSYAVSVPADAALDPRKDVLLAWAMNGAPIPAHHGGPLRAVVPGATAARQVKWLARVRASADEAQGEWQRRDYKLFAPSVGKGDIDWDSAPAMQEMAVTSAICDPAPPVPQAAKSTPPPPPPELARDKDGEVRLRGWAWSGGGRAIQRVDVSADGGASWHTADITAAPDDDSPSKMKSWGWTLWQADVPVQPGPAELVVRALDIAGNSQPERQASIYNSRGLNANAYHRVPVSIK